MGAITRRQGWFWLFASPFLIGLTLFVYIPILWSVVLSFFEARNTIAPTQFAGLDNYRYLLSDPMFRRSLLTFVTFAAGIVPLTYVCSLGLALLLRHIRVGQAFFRSVFFIPAAVSYVTAAMVWRFSFFSGARFGLVNTIIRTFGGDNVNWLGGVHWYHWVVLISLRLWLQVGYFMILLIAGLNRIPTQTYEAAALDGASRWQTLRYITLPQLRPTTTAVLMLLLINAFQAFDEFWNTLATIAGYPSYARPPLVHLYLTSIGGQQQDLGVGGAGTVILTTIIVAFGLLQGRLIRDRSLL